MSALRNLKNQVNALALFFRQTKDDDDDKDLLDIAGVDEDNEEKDLLSQQALLQQALDNSDVVCALRKLGIVYKNVVSKPRRK